MSLPISRKAYFDYYILWDRAIGDPSGIRVRVESYDAAVYHRTRLHMARSIHRTESRDLYDLSDPRHNVSPYDRYMITIRRIPDTDWEFYLLITPRTLGVLAVESLTGTEYEPKWQTPVLEHEPRPQLSSPSGIKLLPQRSGSGLDAPSEESSLEPSTKLDKVPTIPGLRRL